MSKLSFRARSLDTSKPMPIFWSEELPDLSEYAAINRAVPQMPTGMEKEEESEHHLQRAISAQQVYGQKGNLVIPTPEVYECNEDNICERLKRDFKLSRQLIRMQPFGMEQDIPDYDMDSEDETWLHSQRIHRPELTPLKFEEMMDRLEKGSGHQVVSENEAKLLLREDDDLIIAVYDYWLNKRLKTQTTLLPQVKGEKRDGSTSNNPYVAFRRRVEKMQTRKNRKNDEAGYEKMLKLKRDLSRAVTLLELVKRREQLKRDHLALTIEVCLQRQKMSDFSGQILAEVMASKAARPRLSLSASYTQPLHPHNHMAVSNALSAQTGINGQFNRDWAVRNNIKQQTEYSSKKKRDYKKRKHKSHGTGGGGGGVSLGGVVSSVGLSSAGLPGHASSSYDFVASDDDYNTGEATASSPEHRLQPPAEDLGPDGPFNFKRKKFCEYHAPLIGTMGNWPWCSKDEGGSGDKRHCFNLTSVSRKGSADKAAPAVKKRSRCIGFARRRIGRGGRVLLDRVETPMDDMWGLFDFDGEDEAPVNGLQVSEFVSEVRNTWTHFRPHNDDTPDLRPSTSTTPIQHLYKDDSDPWSASDPFGPVTPSGATTSSLQTGSRPLERRPTSILERTLQTTATRVSCNKVSLDSAQFAASAVLNAAEIKNAFPSPTSSATNHHQTSSLSSSVPHLARILNSPGGSNSGAGVVSSLSPHHAAALNCVSLHHNYHCNSSATVMVNSGGRGSEGGVGVARSLFFGSDGGGGGGCSTPVAIVVPSLNGPRVAIGASMQSSQQHQLSNNNNSVSRNIPMVNSEDYSLSIASSKASSQGGVAVSVVSKSADIKANAELRLAHTAQNISNNCQDREDIDMSASTCITPSSPHMLVLADSLATEAPLVAIAEVT